MCGLFFSYISDEVGILTEKEIDYISKELNMRGPDICKIQRSKDNRCIMINSVLQISQPTKDYIFPSLNKDELFGYNGEIYEHIEYQKIKYVNDTTFILDFLRRNKCTKSFYTEEFHGNFATVYGKNVNSEEYEVRIMTDFFGEKNLFVYNDRNTLIISSKPTIIETILRKKELYNKDVDRTLISSYMRSRNMLDSACTFVSDIKQVPSGCCMIYSILKENIKSKVIYNAWGSENIQKIISGDKSDFKGNEFLNYKQFETHKLISAASIFSGGVDSSLMSIELSRMENDIRLLTLTFDDKDEAALSSKELLLSINHKASLSFNINKGLYKTSMEECYRKVLSPLPTHAYPSLNILGQVCNDVGCKVLFGGDGGDEFNFGYPQYVGLLNDGYKKRSPYNSFEMDKELQLWNCWESLKEADKYEDIRAKELAEYIKVVKDTLMCEEVEAVAKANLLLDIKYNLHSTGLLSNDLIISEHSIQARSPFVSIKSLQNMMHTPMEYFNKGPKYFLVKKYKDIFSREPLKKQGFSGFPNAAGEECLSNNDNEKKFARFSDLYGINIEKMGDKMSLRLRWKIINTELYLKQYD